MKIWGMNERRKRKRNRHFTKVAGPVPFTNMAAGPRGLAEGAGRGAGPNGGGARGSRQVRPRPAPPRPPPARFRIGPVPAPQPGGRAVGPRRALATSGALGLLVGGGRAARAGSTGAGLRRDAPGGGGGGRVG